jgi:hypothetical protein
MHEGLRKLYLGDFHKLNMGILDDGSVIVILVKDDEDRVYRFRVRDLYGPNEEVLEHEVIEDKMPDYIKKRIEDARKGVKEKEV